MLNNANITNKNNSNENKQLSVKAYFKNKYEQYKDPNQALLSESQLNAFMMDNLTANSPMANNLSQQVASNHNLNLISANIKSNKRHFSGGSTSSLQNSEDEDDDYDEGSSLTTSREEKRRLSHTAAEQKRRNAIKHGYQLLQKVLPSQQSQFQTENVISTRTTRADTLEQTIDYIHQLEVDKNKHEENVDSLKKEILALKILKNNYEEILKCHRNTPKDRIAEINDETKFEIFTKLSDSLFQSFNAMTSENSFPELSGTMLNWLEQACTSQNLKHIVRLTLMQLQQMS